MKCKKESVKVVMDIDSTAYSVLCNGVDPDMVASIYYKMNLKEFVETLIGNSVPLPKGHGRLIDTKDIDANCITYHTDYDGSWCYRVTDIENNVPTIIEADKEGAGQ